LTPRLEPSLVHDICQKCSETIWNLLYEAFGAIQAEHRPKGFWTTSHRELTMEFVWLQMWDTRSPHDFLLYFVSNAIVKSDENGLKALVSNLVSSNLFQ